MTLIVLVVVKLHTTTTGCVVGRVELVASDAVMTSDCQECDVTVMRPRHMS